MAAAIDPQQRAKELNRRRRERLIILVILALVPVITWLETQVIHLAPGMPMGGAFLALGLININAILLLLLIFLVLRNFFKLLMERREGVLGSSLRAKLVVAFVTLSLAPTILLFFAAYQFVGTSIEYWFSAQVERSLFQALQASEDFNHNFAERINHFAGQVALDLEERGLKPDSPPERLREFLDQRLERFDLTAIKLFDPAVNQTALVTASGTHPSHLDGLPLDLVARALADGHSLSHLVKAPTGDFAAAVVPLGLAKSGGRVVGAVVAYRLLPPGALTKSQEIREGLDSYRQLKNLRAPIATNQYLTLFIVFLLIVFAATWFGFHLAKTITVPLMEMAQGTQRVAAGDYDVFVEAQGPDEIGTLISAFNRMTADLKTARARLNEYQLEMQRTALELDRRRRYMEIVFQNVAAGVVTADSDGVVTTFNPSAERLLKVPADQVVHKHWRELLRGPHRELMSQMLLGLTPQTLGSLDRQVRLDIAGEALTLVIHLSRLTDTSGQDLGTVMVFENLTELEKAQRMAAWREVARRIAHEVKNPLTPIKLSAQRLLRRYGEQFTEPDDIFLPCVETIITQTEELKRLVNEFHTFARLPASRLAPASLDGLAREVVTMYKNAHADISFEYEREGDPPIFDLDREQMKRVLVNLLDNAVTAVAEAEPPHQVAVRLSHDQILKMVRLEVEDTGLGLSPEAKLRLFEPYFSTKKQGTGLGLAIVSTIVADHNGYLRVRDNQPQGTRIIIELPTRGAQRPGEAA